MGYHMTMRDSLFEIKKENAEKALNAIKALADPVLMQDTCGGGGSYKGEKMREVWYSWVNTEEFLNAKTLTEAIKAWRWIAEEDEAGNIWSIWFNGEKLGDDEILFTALAPYMEEGNYIEMTGEDGALWRWEVEDGELVSKTADISWE
jgi:hypothetical protein